MNGRIVLIDRLEYIAIDDPEWAFKLSDFMIKFPEFAKFRAISPKSSILSSEIWMPKTLFENIIYYAAASGVRYDYALDQFKDIVSFIRNENWGNSNTRWENVNANLYGYLNRSTMTLKRKTLYWDIFCWMGNRKITDQNLTVKDALLMKSDIKGLGDGYYAYIKKMFTTDDDCIEYTDRNFIKGFDKVYGKTDPRFIQEKISQFLNCGFGRIANLFMFQICHYA